MSRLLCCCVLLLASPAFAGSIEITENITVTLDNFETFRGLEIEIRGDSRLTVDLPEDGQHGLAKMRLYDTASLEVLNGELRGAIQFRGDNYVRFVGGSMGSIVNYPTNTRGVVDIEGGRFHGVSQQYPSDLTVNVSGGDTHVVTGSLVNVFAKTPVVDFILGYWRAQDISIEPFNYMVRINSQAPFAIYDTDTERPAGDINDDGQVDLYDFNAVRNGFGYPHADLGGDTLPFDGKVDLTDLNRVRNTFGSSTQTTVPEPASLTVLALTSGCMFLATRRHWRCYFAR